MTVSGVAVVADADAALIARARMGDQDAFAALISPRADRVLRIARAIVGEESAAHDATQNALVSAWINLPRLRDANKFDAWINRVVRNECLTMLRQRRRVREIDISATDMAGNRSHLAPDSVSASLETTAIKNAFRRLSVDDRMILLLHHLYGLPTDEVAVQLGIPSGTAKSRLWKARRSLERALEAER